MRRIDGRSAVWDVLHADRDRDPHYSLFSTPLLAFTPADHERINATLSTLILQREASVPPHRGYGGHRLVFSHDLSMLEWAGEPLRALFAPVIEVAKQVTTLSERCGHGGCRLIGMWSRWANVQRNGGANAAHHTRAVLGRRLYVDVGEVCPQETKGGELQIYDPRGCLPRMLAPYPQYSMTELHDAGTSISYTPTLRPMSAVSWLLFHAVNTYRGSHLASVSFNLDPVFTSGKLNGGQKIAIGQPEQLVLNRLQPFRSVVGHRLPTGSIFACKEQRSARGVRKNCWYGSGDSTAFK